jgi:DUF971 family protein
MDVPIEIKIDRELRRIVVTWTNGEERGLNATRLRRACKCAQCRRIRLSGGTVEAPARIAIEGLQAMGYGVQIEFSDGHARGIYPWRYLSELSAEFA